MGASGDFRDDTTEVTVVFPWALTTDDKRPALPSRWRATTAAAVSSQLVSIPRIRVWPSRSAAGTSLSTSFKNNGKFATAFAFALRQRH